MHSKAAACKKTSPSFLVSLSYKNINEDFIVSLSLMDPSPSSFPPPQKSSKIPSFRHSHNQAECTAIYLYTLTSFLFLVSFQSLTIQKTTSPPPSLPTLMAPTPKKPLLELTFHPLKDPSVPPYKHPNKTWFMSTLTGRAANGLPELFIFPSRHNQPSNKILCLNIRNKSYALASSSNAFPSNATILKGLTFVADSFYDYENPWHGLNAVSGFFAWMKETNCVHPRRFLLFKNGEVVKRVGSWVYNLTKAGLDGGEVVVEGLEGSASAEVVCLERAVVMRRGLGGMSGVTRNGVFEMLRCKAWRYCNCSSGGGGESDGRGEVAAVKIGLVGREGKRGFKNESGVREVMERECGKVKGCSLRLIHFKKMSFCDQVKAMRNIDILASTHGAQLSNMMFMPKGSSVMEMFPTGWLEAAGVGQFIYQWFASWSEMHYAGAWRDANGLNCSTAGDQQRSKCFLLQKDQPVDVNETYLASWTARVIAHHVELKRKGHGVSTQSSPSQGADRFSTCSCGPA